MTKDEWFRNRLVAKYWCDKMRGILSEKKDPPQEPKQLSLKLVIPRKEQGNG